MNEDRTFSGWAVSATAYRETSEKFQVRTRAFTVATHERVDAERYVHDEMAKDFPAVEGWEIITAVQPVWLLSCEV